MSFIQPFTIGEYLFVEVLSTTPPYIVHRTVHLAGQKFNFFKTFKNVNPDSRNSLSHSGDLRHEADVLRLLELPSVPKFCDFGEVKGHSYLVMEYIWGKSLLHILRELKAHRKMLSPDFASHIAGEVCRCIGQAHALRSATVPEGIAHYNLSPRNIIISYSGEVHLVDFGHRSPRLSRDTWDQFEFRNLSYLSPEQVTCSAVSPRADLFTMGSILYEMITGMPPFLEKTPEKVINRIARCSFQEPCAVHPGVPHELGRLVLQAMSAYPDDRFATATEMGHALDHYMKRSHSTFTTTKVRKLMRTLFEKDIVGDIKFFGKLADVVAPEARLLVRSIPRILFDEVRAEGSASNFEGLELGSALSGSGSGSRSRSRTPSSRPGSSVPASASPDSPSLMPPADGGIRSTMNYTLEELQTHHKNARRGIESFFEDEDSILVGEPGAVRIIPVHAGGPAPQPQAAPVAAAPAATGGSKGLRRLRTSILPFGEPGAQGKPIQPPPPMAWERESGLEIPSVSEAATRPAPVLGTRGSPSTAPAKRALSGGLLPAEDERSHLIGKQLGEYTITGVLGWGGMGTVYDGIQPTIGKEVAIKVLNPTLCANPQIAQRFLAEAKAVNSIRNPNIIDIFSFGIFEEHYHYFVMEKLNGITLGSFLLQHRIMPMDVAFEILAQVFSAVSAAHEKGIIHRDLKPDNIYLEKRPLYDHYVKILDFGIAKFTVSGFKSAITKAGTPIGTPKYMSPEQCRGVEVTASSDIYTLGVILYEMFTGTLPFRKNSYMEMLLAHLNETPTRPSMLVKMDPALENMILWTLHKDPKDRPSSVRELSDNLLAYLKTKK
ncbi:serine/threonine protein kinase [Myxococcota bacterium]|nr:serine/threonine protein kinase [Myxococcota bacterium]